MTEDEKKYDEIEQYLRGELTGAALQAFEEKLQQDPDWQREVSLHRQLGNFLADEGGLRLREALTAADRETQRPRIIPIYRRTMLAAASILLLAIAGYVIWQVTNKPTTTQLFAQNFEPYQMVLSSRSGNNVNELRNAAINAYQQGHYQEAIPYLDQLIQQDSLALTFAFYKGICYLASGKTAQAIPLLDSVQKVNNPVLTEQATWYLGLAYLRQGNKQKACPLFTELKSAKGFKYEQAVKLSRLLCE